MVDYSQTISNSLEVWGLAPTSRWGTATFGSSFWAFGDLAPKTVSVAYRTITDTVTPSDTVSTLTLYFRTIPISVMPVDSVLPAADFVINLLTEILSVSSDLSRVVLTDHAGYDRVFRGSTTNLAGKINTTYSGVSALSTSYTSIATSVTSWSTSI